MSLSALAALVELLSKASSCLLRLRCFAADLVDSVFSWLCPYSVCNQLCLQGLLLAVSTLFADDCSDSVCSLLCLNSACNKLWLRKLILAVSTLFGTDCFQRVCILLCLHSARNQLCSQSLPLSESILRATDCTYNAYLEGLLSLLSSVLAKPIPYFIFSVYCQLLVQYSLLIVYNVCFFLFFFTCSLLTVLSVLLLSVSSVLQLTVSTLIAAVFFRRVTVDRVYCGVATVFAVLQPISSCVWYAVANCVCCAVAHYVSCVAANRVRRAVASCLCLLCCCQQCDCVVISDELIFFPFYLIS